MNALHTSEIVHRNVNFQSLKEETLDSNH